MAAKFLGLAVSLLHSDELKRLESRWVDEIADTYLRWLARALANGESADDLNAVLADEDHALLIALTEINRGENAGAIEAYKANRVKRVRWVTTSPDPCPECVMNRAAGPWPLGHPFPSGAIAPPDHPHCACHLEPA
jgi:hypothetical protein